ncbi:hypothetical protein OQA88_657 [Cercophora sp. LCS_1]
MHLHLLLLLIPAATTAVLSRRDDEINLPAIQPPFSEEIQDRHFRSVLSYRQSQYRPWSPAWIPQKCLEEAKYNNLDPSAFSVRDVWYSDCLAAWTICRHNDASESWDSIINTLSQVPVGMRQFIANLVILPSSVPSSPSAVAYTRGSVLVFTPSFFKLGVLFHEITHILDTTAPSLQRAIVERGYAEGTPFSRTALWTWAVANDTAVPTPYARSTLQEAFADAGRWAMSDMVSKDGLEAFSTGWEGCRHQIRAYERWLGDVVFTRGGVCTGKVDSSVPVRMPGRDGAAGKPGSTLDGTGLEEIVLGEGVEELLFVYPGEVPNW